MSNIRLYVESEITKSVEIKISKDKIHYLKNVMKVRNNQKFFYFQSIFLANGQQNFIKIV